MRMLLDSNLIIYAAQPAGEALRTYIAREVPYVSVVSKVETLGYPDLTENEERYLEEFFEAAAVLGVSQPVIAEAILRRQQRRMSLGDAFYCRNSVEPWFPVGNAQYRRFCVD